MTYVTKYQDRAYPDLDYSTVNEPQLSMDLLHQGRYIASTTDSLTDPPFSEEDYRTMLSSPSFPSSDNSSLMSSTLPATLPTNRGGTALHKAAYAGHDELVRLLLDEGADIDALDTYGSTPLHLACEIGYVNISNILLSRGSDSKIKDNLGWTPLDWAAEYNNAIVVWSLIQKGVNIDSVDNLGQTALHRAAEGGRYDIARMLLNEGANPNLQSVTNEF